MQSSATTATPRLSKYWRSSVSRCLIFLLAAMLTLSLASCATTGNIPPNYDVLAPKNSGLVLFSVTHDKDTIVKLLLDRGAKPNIVPNDHSGWTALMAAAARGHANTVALLLQNGADPNIKSKDGRTAIELARAEGQAEVVRKFSAIGN